jgi:ketosteroid isomerase-like protein
VTEPKSPRVVIQRLLTESGKGQWDGLADLYAEDATVSHPLAADQTAPLQGRAALRAHFQRLAASGVRLTVRDLVIHQSTDPEIVIADFTYDGADSDGIGFSMPACFIWRVRNGQVVEARDFLGPRVAAPARANKAIVAGAFAAWAAGSGSFFDIVAEDVSWTVMGSGSSAGLYQGKAAFMERIAGPFATQLVGELRPTLLGIWVEADDVVVRWSSSATTVDGTAYRNAYVFILTLRDGLVVAAEEFLDLPAFELVWSKGRAAFSSREKV